MHCFYLLIYLKFILKQKCLIKLFYKFVNKKQAQQKDNNNI